MGIEQRRPVRCRARHCLALRRRAACCRRASAVAGRISVRQGDAMKSRMSTGGTRSLYAVFAPLWKDRGTSATERGGWGGTHGHLPAHSTASRPSAVAGSNATYPCTLVSPSSLHYLVQSASLPWPTTTTANCLRSPSPGTRSACKHTHSFADAALDTVHHPTP